MAKYKVLINGLVKAENEQLATKAAEGIIILVENHFMAVENTFGVVSVEKVEEGKDDNTL